MRWVSAAISELCDPALGCQAGAPPIVDDGIVCTLDSCDETTDRVGHVPEDAACDDLDPCTADRCEATGCASSEIPGCGLPDLSIGDVVGPAAVGAGTSARPEAMALDLNSSSDDIGPVTISFILSRDEAVDTADTVVGNCIIAEESVAAERGVRSMEHEIVCLVAGVRGASHAILEGRCDSRLAVERRIADFRTVTEERVVAEGVAG